MIQPDNIMTISITIKVSLAHIVASSGYSPLHCVILMFVTSYVCNVHSTHKSYMNIPSIIVEHHYLCNYSYYQF